MHSILFIGLIFSTDACCIKKKIPEKRIENPVHKPEIHTLKKSPDFYPEDFQKIRNDINNKPAAKPEK